MSASELGIDPHEVADGLRHVLNVSYLSYSVKAKLLSFLFYEQRASIWNAVLLIDEADVLLEKRGSNDVSALA